MRVLTKQIDLDTESPEEDGSNLRYYNENNQGCFSVCLKSKQRRKVSFTIFIVSLVIILVGLLIQRLIYNHDLKIVNDVIQWQDARYAESYHFQYNYNFVDDLKSLCEKTLWRPAVFLNCTITPELESLQDFKISSYGVSEIRNSFISCLRLAIDGGTNLILPHFGIKKDKKLTHFDHWEELDYLFNEVHFRSLISLECPQLRIYDATYDVETKIISDSNNSSKYIFQTYYNHVDKLLEKSKGYSESMPIVILENHAYLAWYFNQDSRKIRDILYKALPFNVNLTLSAETIRSNIPQAFIGIHLLKETDSNSITYETQTNPMLEYLNTNLSHIKTVYITTNDEDIELRLHQDLANKNINVVSLKTILAKTKKQIILNNLSSYQVEAIDFIVINYAEFFFGIGTSSLSYSIALERGEGDILLGNSRLNGGVINDYLECM